LEWLALSIGSRSAVWNLKNGKTYPFSPFNGGSISADGVWTTTFEQTEPGTTTQGDKKFFVRASVDLSVGKDVSYVKLPDKKPGETVAFSGPYEFTTLTNSPEKGWHTIRVKDTRTGQIAWTREMDMMPQRQLGNALVLGFPAADKYADSVIKKSAELKKRLEEIPRRQDATLLEVLDVATGKPLGYVMVDAAAGSVQIRSVRVGGRTLFLEDNNNRMLAYSLDTGERTGQEFGQVLAIDPVRTQVAVQNQLGRIMVFDASMQRVAEFEYPRNVIFAGFDGQGRRLLTVTGAQEVFIENLP